MIGSVILKTKSSLDGSLENLWTFRSLLSAFFKKTNAFLVYAICFHETVHDEWCNIKAFGKLETAWDAVLLNTRVKSLICPIQTL